jgi:hypothetical protein
LYFRPGELLPAYNLVPRDRYPFLGANVFPEGSYFDLVVKARFLKSEYGFAYATSFYLTAALAAGFKGMNHHMFVDHDRWYGAPLHQDGTIAEGYDQVSNFNQALMAIGIDDMKSDETVAVVGIRLYSWLRLTSSENQLTYVPRLVDQSAGGFCRDLLRFKLPFGVRENRDWETLKKYQLVFIPCAEVMSTRDQEAIIELAKAGTTIIACGLMPRYDEDFRDCQILANHFRIKTNVETHISTVAHKQGEFPAHIYGAIRSTDDAKTKKLVKSGAKVVGVCSSRLKGRFYFFSFDIASGGDHNKLAFIESILAQEKISPNMYCSDPAVDVSFTMSDKHGLLFVAAPPPGELSDGIDPVRKEVIVKADLRKAGFRTAKFKMTNLFDGAEAKPLKLTAQELAEGISLTIDVPDGLVFLVERSE